MLNELIGFPFMKTKLYIIFSFSTRKYILSSLISDNRVNIFHTDTDTFYSFRTFLLYNIKHTKLHSSQKL